MIIEGRQHEGTGAKTLRFAPRTILVIDRGSGDYAWFPTLTHQGSFFVTRAKDNAVSTVLETRRVPNPRGIIQDELSSSPRPVARRLTHLLEGPAEWRRISRLADPGSLILDAAGPLRYSGPKLMWCTCLAIRRAPQFPGHCQIPPISPASVRVTGGCPLLG